MSLDARIAGREMVAADLEFIRAVLAEEDDWSRWRLSREIARRLEWYSPTGQLKDMACRELLLKLDRRGLITLPAPRCRSPSGHRRKPPPEVPHAQDPVTGVLRTLQPLRLEVVTRGSEADDLIRHLLVRYHYLGLDRTAGATIRYRLQASDGRLLGCALWSSAAWKTAARDRYLGWDASQRQAHLPYLVNNARFLVLPWVRVPHLASHALGLMTRRLRDDWQAAYGLQPLLAETFVDGQRYAGTCYRAAGWQLVGKTVGRSRNDRHHAKQVARKLVFLKPLTRHWCLGLGLEER